MKRRILFLFLLCLFLTACASAPEQTEFSPPEENRLVIYTSHKEDVYRPIIREFEERTGIWVELVTGGTSELLERIEQEKADPKADIMFGGGVESLESCRELFCSVRCRDADLLAPGPFQPENRWTPFSALPIVLIYNTKLVDPGSLTCWEDLTSPEFHGRIAFADPTKSGSSFTALVTAVTAFGEDMLGTFASLLDGKQLNSSGEVLNAVVDGSCLVGVTLEETALQRIAAGDNLAMVYPTDGTSCVPDGTAVILGAPHGENAEKFLNFTLSLEVQRMLGSRFYRRSVRQDVTAPESLIPMDEIVRVDYDAQWAAENRERLLNAWDKVIKEAAK